MIDKSKLFETPLATRVVTLPVGDMLIKEFNTATREQFEVMALKAQSGGMNGMKSKIIAMSCITDSGTRYFGDDEIDKISELPATITEVLFTEILDINGMGSDALGDTEGN